MDLLLCGVCKAEPLDDLRLLRRALPVMAMRVVVLVRMRMLGRSLFVFDGRHLAVFWNWVLVVRRLPVCPVLLAVSLVVVAVRWRSVIVRAVFLDGSGIRLPLMRKGGDRRGRFSPGLLGWRGGGCGRRIVVRVGV